MRFLLSFWTSLLFISLAIYNIFKISKNCALCSFFTHYRNLSWLKITEEFVGKHLVNFVETNYESIPIIIFLLKLLKEPINVEMWRSSEKRKQEFFCLGDMFAFYVQLFQTVLFKYTCVVRFIYMCMENR